MLIQKPDGPDLVVLVHKGNRPAYQGDALLNEVVQQVADIQYGDALLLAAGFLLRGVDQSADGVFHHQKRGDVVVDRKNGRHPPPAVPNVHGGGFQDFSVRRAGQIAQMVWGIFLGVQNLLHDHGGRAVSQPAPGYVAVDDADDGALRVLGCQIVNHHFTAGAELRCQSVGDLLEHFQTFCVQYAITSRGMIVDICRCKQHPSMFLKPIITAFLAECKRFSKNFLGFQKFCLTTAFSVI